MRAATPGLVRCFPSPQILSSRLCLHEVETTSSLAYLINPEPEMENIGVAGGLIDHPWRYSDDLNRILFGLKCLLGPGRFIAESVFDARWLWHDETEDSADPNDESP